MAQLKNNKLSREPIENRLYRLLRMQNNIDTHAVELGIAGLLLVWAQNCHTRFSGAYTDAGIESGESKDSTLMVHEKFDTTLDYYQQAKEILDATLAQYKPDDILLASYGIDDPTPRTYLALTEAIDKFEAAHNRLVAELDERVIAQAIIDQMVLYGNEFEAELETAGIEKKESDVAYQKQHSYYAEDTIKLRLIFKIACMVWGDDDPKLKDLGFVPSSEVWTPGQPEPWLPPWPGPAETFTAVLIEPGVVELVYSGVQESTMGWLYRRKPGTEDWILVAEDLPMNAEDIIPFRDYGVPPGTWEFRFIPMRGEEHGEPSYAIIDVT